MKRFDFWNPLTSDILGLSEDEVVLVHNRPFLQVAEALQTDGEWRCDLIYFTHRRRPWHTEVNDVRWSFYPVFPRGTWGSRRYLRQFSIPGILALLTRRPNVVGFHAVGGRFAALAARFCRWLGIPYIINVAGWDLRNDPRRHRYFSEATCVLVPTNRQKRWMKSQGYDDSNVIVVPMGVDTAKFCPTQTQYQVGKGPQLLFVGRLEPSKGGYEALQTLRYVREEFPEARLKVIGPETDPAYVSMLRTYIHEYQLEETVKLIGTVAHDELPAHFAAADVLLFPSKRECQPYAVAEAMACGTPVIALRDSGGTDEMIVHGETGLLVDVPGMVHETLRLLYSPKIISAMSAKSVRRARQEYSIERTVSGFRTALSLALQEAT